MQRTLLGCAFLGLSVFSATPAFAQAFHEGGKVSVALERAFGIHYTHQEWDSPGAGEDRDEDGTTFGIGWYAALTPLHWARAAVDVFVIDRLSVGGSVAFFTQTGDPDWDGILFAPRVGYAIPISRVFTFWPRGGVVFYDIESRNVFGLAGEAMFAASPHPSWSILFGPTLDLGFSGDDNDNDFSEISVGLVTVGLMGTF